MNERNDNTLTQAILEDDLVSIEICLEDPLPEAEKKELLEAYDKITAKLARLQS